MAKQTINIGSAANDGTGSTLRESFDITNDNFTELYGGTGGLFHKIEGTNFTGSLLIGHSTTGTLSSAQNNTGIGIGTLDALTSGDSNVAVGYAAGTAVTTGVHNTLIGVFAGDNLAGGGNNVAIGGYALSTEDTHGKNVAVGYGALTLQDAGADAYSVAVGYLAGTSISTGVQNTVVGGLAGDALSTGASNVAIGFRALSGEDTGSLNIAIGQDSLIALNYNGNGYNTSIGYEAGKAVSTGRKNTILGAEAGDALTTGSNNIIIGYAAAASAVGVDNEITLGDSNISTVRIPSDSTLKIGASGDLQLEHLSGQSFIKNTDTGNLYIENQVDNGDVLFRSDDGAGGLATYFYLDGGLVNNSTVLGATRFPDLSKIYMGSGGDLEIYHDATDTWLDNFTGNLNIRNQQNSGDIIFRCDNGNGGVAEYFRLDGGDTITRVARNFRANDNVALQVGVDGDAGMYHDGTDTYFQNDTGNLILLQNTNDGDIIFKSDDGSNGVAEYFRVDGGATKVIANKNFAFVDGVKAEFGDSGDLQIFHDGSNSFIDNSVGNLDITQLLDNGDIRFRSDNGSGGVETYFYLDGSEENVTFSKDIVMSQNAGPTLNMNTNSAGNTSKILLHEGTTSSPANGASIRYDGSANTFKIGVGTDVDTTRLTIDRGSGLATFANNVSVTGSVGIGTDSPAALLEISGSGDAVRIESTNSGAAGAQIDLLHFTASPADNDVNALINFGGYYTGTTSAYANQIKSVWSDVSDRDAELQFFTNNAGTLTKALTLDTGQNATFAGNIISETTGGNAGIKVITANDAEGFLVFGDAQDNSMGGMAYNNATNSLDIDCNNAVALSFDSSRNATFAATVTTGNDLTIGGTGGIFIPAYIYHVGDTNTYFGFGANDVFQVNTGGSERMRADANGNLLVGMTSPLGGATDDYMTVANADGGRGGIRVGNSGGSSNTSCVRFHNSNGVVGTIRTDGSATAYDTSSDYRLKEDLKDFAGLDMVSKIPVYDFKWKVDDSRSYGVMAHELQEVIPNAVSGEKDAEEMQGVDYSKIVPLLIKSIQELEARVKTLENK